MVIVPYLHHSIPSIVLFFLFIIFLLTMVLCLRVVYVQVSLFLWLHVLRVLCFPGASHAQVFLDPYVLVSLDSYNSRVLCDQIQHVWCVLNKKSCPKPLYSDISVKSSYFVRYKPWTTVNHEHGNCFPIPSEVYWCVSGEYGRVVKVSVIRKDIGEGDAGQLAELWVFLQTLQ